MTRKDKYSIDGFKYPAPDKVASRISTICRSMASTMTERKACSIDEENEWKLFFSDQTCAYCGTKATHLDHLFPLVEERLPTGYGTDPSNLVPCCSRCNQKKGNRNWREYMNSDDCVYEGDRKKQDYRILNMENFQKTMPARKVDIELIKDDWKEIICKTEKMLEDINKKLDTMQNTIYKNL